MFNLSFTLTGASERPDEYYSTKEIYSVPFYLHTGDCIEVSSFMPDPDALPNWIAYQLFQVDFVVWKFKEGIVVQEVYLITPEEAEERRKLGE